METFLFDIVSHAPEDTFAAGAYLATLLGPGAVVALHGPLGAGKTYFVKGAAEALGTQDRVTSPTFTLVHEYEAPVPIYHIDAYRLSGERDFVDLGGEELLDSEHITFIEWSERIPKAIPGDAFVVEFELLEGDSRRLRGFKGQE